MKTEFISREMTREVIVGAFIVMVFLGLGYFTIILSHDKWFGAKYSREVVFKDVMGLRVGDNVVCRGMPVGKVKTLKLKDDGVHVAAVLDQSLDIREDYEARIIATSILGGRYLQISEGSKTRNELSPKMPMIGLEPYDLIADASVLVNSTKKAFTEEGILDNLKDASREIKEITERMNAGKGVLGKLLADDDTMYNNLSDAVTSMKNIAAKIEKGEGMLGRMVNDDSLYTEIEDTIGEARAAIDDFRETAPVVTFTSIFFGAF